MDFTFLFLTILMIMAAQSGAIVISAAIFLILLISSKDKMLLLASGVAATATIYVYLLQVKTLTDNLIIIGALFAILVILVKSDADHPQPQNPYGGY